MGTSKKGITQLAQVCAAKGVRHAVVSPGSRNAPLTLAFAAIGSVEMLNIPDERTAAFFALGIAQATRKPVVLICTSGTAALNYAPAIAEAYYQRIPLLVLTSDRPEEMIDQGEGQSIRQQNIYRNYIRASYQFPQEASNEDELSYGRRICAEALDRCLVPVSGPTHINVPLKEPLYDRSDLIELPVPPAISIKIDSDLAGSNLKELDRIWQRSEKVMVLLGTFAPNRELNKALEAFTTDPKVAVLTETNANVHGNEYCHNIDLSLSSISSDKLSDFTPDLLITFGENIISKKVKAWIRSNKPKAHWHVDPEMKHYDTFQCLSHHIPIEPLTFLEQFAPEIKPSNKSFGLDWTALNERSLNVLDSYLAQAPYSDLTVLNTIHRSMPPELNVHYANSTSVRYAQLFPHRGDLNYFANRGTSGIDGCTSTAAGSAHASKAPTLLITGDVAFFYDSNALWNHHLSEHLRIVMINNEGGNIFRIIDGPDATGQLEEHFEAKHNTSAEYLAKTYNVPYYFCDDPESIEATLPEFFAPQNGRPAILEIKTPNKISAQVMRDLFKTLEEQ